MGMEGWTLLAREQIAEDEWIVLHSEPHPLGGIPRQYATHREHRGEAGSAYFSGDYFAQGKLIHAIVNFCERAGILGQLGAVLDTAWRNVDKEAML